jgi:hypothetical protein
MDCRRAFLGCCGRENPDSCYIFLFSHFSSKHPGQTAFHRSSGEKKRGFWRAFPLLLWACLVLIFIRFLAKTCPNRLRFLRHFVTACLWPAANTRAWGFPKSQLPQCVFKKSAPFSSLHPESPAHPVPCRPDSSPICDSGALPGLPSLAQAPFATPVRRSVPVARDSHVDPLSAARAGHPQRPWSIARQVLLHHSPDPAEMSP